MFFSTYIALAPNQFHPGWTYAVTVTVNGVTNGQAVTVTGNIYASSNPKDDAQGLATQDGQISLQNGNSIQILMLIAIQKGLQSKEGWSWAG